MLSAQLSAGPDVAYDRWDSLRNNREALNWAELWHVDEVSKDREIRVRRILIVTLA